MPLYRFQAVMEHRNGLPRDTVVNTFHVTNAEAGDVANIAAAVRAFYTGIYNGGRAVASWLADTHENVYVKAYLVDDQIVEGQLVSNSGEPVHTTAASSLAINKQSAVNLPSEVALVLSLRDTTTVAVPRARRTGRVFIGPLNAGANSGGDAGHVARPQATFAGDLRQAAFVMADAIVDAGGQWCVYSRPFPGRAAGIDPRNGKLVRAIAERPVGGHYLIDQVWTDDAFDTQRRRGERATAKSVSVVG
jgi:hypothetical protein